MARKSLTLPAVVATAALATAAPFAAATPWSFGVMSDNQWTEITPTPIDDGYNPNTVPVSIIKQIDQQFVAKGVKLVIDVGDSVDVGTNLNIDTTAAYRQDLYNKGIGFFPLRGNHEAGVVNSGTEWKNAFPQMQNGLNNATPSSVLATVNNPANNPDLANQPVPAVIGAPFTMGTNFSQAPTNAANNSMSYSFDYNNTRFVMIDQFDNTGNTNNTTLGAQQGWITGQLSDPSRPEQAFVFSHKNLLGGNHKDNLFGNTVKSGDPGDGSGLSGLTPSQQTALNTKLSLENNFIDALANNQVHYYISGHDHHQYNSQVTDGNGKSVQQIISASDSSKFYAPAGAFSANDTPISEDLFKIGYYIYTVDGPRVTVDYYGVNVASDLTPGGILIKQPAGTQTTPDLSNFTKVLSFGYSLNGKQVMVGEGQSYTAVSDTSPFSAATAAKILGGTNTSNGTSLTLTGSGFTTEKPLSKAVNTGWTDRAGDPELASDILTIWGMNNSNANTTSAGITAAGLPSATGSDATLLTADQTDTYTLSMNFDPTLVTVPLDSGAFALATLDPSGHWVNAVDLNVGGTKTFVFGAWNSSYGLGTYGIDTTNGADTAWAVINHASEFAAATVPAPSAAWAGLALFGGLVSFRAIRRRRAA